jgi:hypothetical protein
VVHLASPAAQHQTKSNPQPLSSCMLPPASFPRRLALPPPPLLPPQLAVPPQADAKLPEKDESVALEEFVAAPWLLPQRCRALNYTEVHDLDMLLTLRSAPWPEGLAGSFPKAITVLLFSKSIAAMFQNTREALVVAGLAGRGSWGAAAGRAPELAATAVVREPAGQGKEGRDHHLHPLPALFLLAPCCMPHPSCPYSPTWFFLITLTIHPPPHPHPPAPRCCSLHAGQVWRGAQLYCDDLVPGGHERLHRPQPALHPAARKPDARQAGEARGS